MKLASHLILVKAAMSSAAMFQLMETINGLVLLKKLYLPLVEQADIVVSKPLVLKLDLAEK